MGRRYQRQLPQCSSSLLSPQSSSWSHLKAIGMQDPEATQRNWLVGSQVVVAKGFRRRRSKAANGKKKKKKRSAGVLRHSCSSLMSPQSLSLSHFQMLLMQRPLEQRYWLGKQLRSDGRRAAKLITQTPNSWTSPAFRRRLTGLDAGFVLQLVATGALALQLAVGRGHGRGAVRADAGVSVTRLGQTEEAARPIGTGVVAW